MAEEFWFKDPSILFTKDSWNKFVPTPNMSTTEALNSVVRFTIYFSIILYVCTTVGAYLMAIPVVMVTTIILIKLFPNGKVLEAFLNTKPKSPQKNFTMPTDENPFMNVLLTDIDRKSVV